jgi:NTP pyrophosphatase (non-canonical NTP hydrolase)
VDEAPDEVEKRLRELMGRRHFVDRESGVLLIWLAAEVGELADAVGQLETRHPTARFSVQESGAALAVRMTARDQELAEIEALYVAG